MSEGRIKFMLNSQPKITINSNRFRITDLIGTQDGIGVENLSLAGMVAAETSRAYTEIVTISMVTCRAIGIGSYLLRLGQRVVQIENSHIILTGFAALNKVLGSAVYSSNDQLGGIPIMFSNGVSHATEGWWGEDHIMIYFLKFKHQPFLVLVNDLEGVYRMLSWLSYIPDVVNGGLPIVVSNDSVDRPVEFRPSRSPYDPRQLFTGSVDSMTGQCIPGFFDQDSWSEIMPLWAQTVITGRARLSGIPVGVIAAETRMVEHTVPADPANTSSESKVSFSQNLTSSLSLYLYYIHFHRQFNKPARFGTKTLPTKPRRPCVTSTESNCHSSCSPIGADSRAA